MLETIDILNNDGTLSENATLYVGKDRFEVRKEVKGAKAKYHSAQGYIRQMRHYLKHGDWCTDFYGPYEEKRIKWVTITPKG